MVRWGDGRGEGKGVEEETYISGSFCVQSMTAAMGMPKLLAGPQKSVRKVAVSVDSACGLRQPLRDVSYFKPLRLFFPWWVCSIEVLCALPFQSRINGADDSRVEQT